MQVFRSLRCLVAARILLVWIGSEDAVEWRVKIHFRSCRVPWGALGCPLAVTGRVC